MEHIGTLSMEAACPRRTRKIAGLHIPEWTQLDKKVPYREKVHHPKMSVSLMS